MFAEKYLRSLNTSDLRDDDQHHQTEALAAAALADLTGGSGEVLGSLLTRVKYASGTHHKTFEAGNRDLAVLLRVWIAVVRKRGGERGWVEAKPRTEWDANAMLRRYDTVARQSLAHWLDGHCEVCRGTKVSADHRKCVPCGGTGNAPIAGDELVAIRTRDMINELEGLYQSHSARAGAKMRRAA